MFCPNCGNQVNDNSPFCTKCGTKLNDAPQQAAPQQVDPQQPVQPQYQQPAQPAQSQDEGKGMSIAGLVLGICSAALSYLFAVPLWPLSFLFLGAGIAGIIMAVNGRKKSTAFHGKASGLATAGLVLSIIGTSLSGSVAATCATCATITACTGEEIYDDYYDDYYDDIYDDYYW